ncbi:MAG: hypothetical protein P8X57_05145 [Cyclobacteriaceae bacterium]
MKDLKTIFITVGIGSAMAWLMSGTINRNPLNKAGKSIRKFLKADRRIMDDENDMRYI